jgi:tRNA1(Val) A37 N6-methylase TrmN6
MGHAAGDAGLQEWVDCMQRIVKPLGSVSLIHRADHLDKVLQAFGSRFGGIEIWPFYSKAGEAANRIVIRALKNRKSPTVLHPPVIVHGDDGGFTPEADVLLRDAKALK